MVSASPSPPNVFTSGIPPTIKTSRSNNCHAFQYDFHENIALSVVFALSFIIGLVLVFVGYRIFRVSLFIQAFSLASLFTYSILMEVSNLSILYHGLISVGAGIIVGLLGAIVKTIGILGSSLLQSVFVTVCILYVTHTFVTINNLFVTPGIILACFLMLAVFIFKWGKACYIMYITSYGTILIMLAIDYYLDLSMLRKTAYENLLTLPRVTKPCWFSWTVLLLWPLLVFLGCVVQFFKTGKEYDHKGKRWFASESDTQTRLLSDNGEVIAKVWIQTYTLPSGKIRQASRSLSIIGDDEVFLMEDTTPV